MPKVSGLGTIFAPGQAANVNSASAAIDSTLAPGSSYYGSGDIGLDENGSVGNGLLTQAAQLGQTQVSADTGAMDRDSAALSGLADQYYALAQQGGMGEAAARQVAIADMANLGQGGAGAGKAVTQGSRELVGNAAQAAIGERSANAQGSTQAGAAKAATELQKLVYQAHVSHANHMTAIAAQQYQSTLQNMQAGYDQTLNSGAAAARNGQQSAYQSANATTRQGALSAAQAIMAAGGTAAATYSSMGTVPTQPYTKDAAGGSGGVSFGVPNGTGGMSDQTASVISQPSSSKLAAFNPYHPEAEGNTAIAPDPKQWSTWLAGSTLAP